MIPDDIQNKIKDMLENGKIVSGGIIEVNNKNNIDSDNTISGHYGVTDNNFRKWIKEMICDMIMYNDKTKILDKWFKKEDDLQDIRVKVLAYQIACEYFQKMELNI